MLVLPAVRLLAHFPPTCGRLCRMLTAVPSATSVLLYRREWLEDLDATHRRMLGFEQFACKQNYVRLMCNTGQFGHTIFTVR